MPRGGDNDLDGLGAVAPHGPAKTTKRARALYELLVGADPTLAPALSALPKQSQMAEAALTAKANGGGSDPFYDAKLATSVYFAERVLPEAGAHLAKVKSGAGPVMALSADVF